MTDPKTALDLARGVLSGDVKQWAGSAIRLARLVIAEAEGRYPSLYRECQECGMDWYEGNSQTPEVHRRSCSLWLKP